MGFRRVEGEVDGFAYPDHRKIQTVDPLRGRVWVEGQLMTVLLTKCPLGKNLRTFKMKLPQKEPNKLKTWVLNRQV